MKPNPLSRCARRAGFTLVEIMIGLLIGLIGIVVIMQTFAVSEGYRRTTTSGTDAQVNGGIALYIMERELRIAGYGLTPLVQAGCTSVIVWYNPLGKSVLQRFVPVDINPVGYPAGDPNTDVILIAYGNADSFVQGVITNQQAFNTDGFQVQKNWDGFKNGDLVVGVHQLAPGVMQCVMHEITAAFNANSNCGAAIPTQVQGLGHDTAQYRSATLGCSVNVTPTHNAAAPGIRDPGGTPVAKLTQPLDQVFNLGPSPAVKLYAIHNGNLTTCDTLNADCTVLGNYQVLVNDIVSMHAILGQDYLAPFGPYLGNPSYLGDNQVDRWSRNPLGTANDVLRTLAIAIEVTARSNLKEKPSTGTTCDATPDATRPDRAQTNDWFAPYQAKAVGSLAPAQVNVSATRVDWNCYRYKLFTTLVPLRNLLWRP